MERFRFLSIGSGSSGNCYYVGTGSCGILIDAGVGVRQLKKALKENDIALEHIWGVFITHDHTDHIKSAGVLGEKYNLPIYTTKEIHEGINRNYRVTEKLINCVRHFKKGEHVIIQDLDIQSFQISHDATDSVGFTVSYRDKKFVFATDLGYINKETSDQIAHANYLVIEANYDENMLKNGRYSYPLKQRIRAHTGHLSNIHTAKYLADNWHDGLTHVFLCHLSNENNTPQIAYDTVNEELQKKGIKPEVLYALKRTEPSDMFVFEF